MATNLDVILQILGFVISVGIIPLFFMFRRESRADRAEMRDTLHHIRDMAHSCVTEIAVLKERDRISELLDKRLPRE